MLTVSALKEDLDFNRGFGDIIEVLKTSAVIQFRALQLKKRPNEEFIRRLEASFDIIARKDIRHPYVEKMPHLPSLIVIITSDTGFLGELNILLVNAALDDRKTDNDAIIVIGEQGARYMQETGISFISLPGLSDDVNYRELEGLRDYLFENYGRKFGRVLVVYPEFVSLTLQRIETFQVLPYALPDFKQRRISAVMAEALIGPNEVKLLQRLIELWSGFRLLEIAWSSKQAEYAARIMHLESSTQELSHMNQQIAFNYFRVVHALRDKSIREISASKTLLEKR
jgi:ATP synthase F1 gamma subunit